MSMLKQTQYFEKKANATTTIIIITIIVLFWGRRKKQFTAEDCQISALYTCSFIGNINNYTVMIIYYSYIVLLLLLLLNSQPLLCLSHSF